MTFLSTDPKFSDSDNVLLGKILQQLRDNPGGGGSGSQTPWASAINGGGFNLSNVATITATSVVSALTGNASTATVLQTARTINGVSFNGSANITIPNNQTPWTSNIDAAGFSLLSVDQIQVNGDANFNGNLQLSGVLVMGTAFRWLVDNLYDLGDVADFRPRTAYFGTSVVAPSFVGTLTGGASLNVLKAGDVMTGLLTVAQATANTAILASTGYSLTGSNATSLIDLAGTWNTSGTPTAFKLNIVDTASNAASLLFDYQVGGVSRMKLNKDSTLTLFSGLVISTTGTVQPGGSSGGGALATSGLFLGSDRLVNWSSTTAWSGTADLILARDAANALALRNGVNAQTFRVYNTFTDASNYERLSVAWASNVATIQTANAGTGVVRSLQLGTGNTAGVKLWTDNTIDFQTSSLTTRWTINPSGHILAGADNSYDIGASGATRPRNLYVAGTGTFGGEFVSGGNVNAGQNSFFTWTGRSLIGSPSDGVIRLGNVGGTDFTRLQFGGTTDSFGAVGRDGAGIKIVGAAGGSTAWIKVPGVTVANLPAAGTAGAGAVSYVTDAVSQVFGATVTGGGSVPSPVYSDGTVWRTG